MCQNPDSVLLEQNNIMNEFNRVSSIIKDEVFIFCFVLGYRLRHVNKSLL